MTNLHNVSHGRKFCSSALSHRLKSADKKVIILKSHNGKAEYISDKRINVSVERHEWFDRLTLSYLRPRSKDKDDIRQKLKLTHKTLITLTTILIVEPEKKIELLNSFPLTKRSELIILNVVDVLNYIWFVKMKSDCHSRILNALWIGGTHFNTNGDNRLPSMSLEPIFDHKLRNTAFTQNARKRNHEYMNLNSRVKRLRKKIKHQSIKLYQN